MNQRKYKVVFQQFPCTRDTKYWKILLTYNVIGKI